jgi:hypothetical protein
MELEEALDEIVDRLRQGPQRYGNDGYEVDLLTLLTAFLSEQHGKRIPNPGANPRLRELSEIFYAAAWELCRRGILRPGVKAFGGRVTDQGAGGAGYAITPLGRRWLADDGGERFDLIDPTQRSKLLAQYAERFGPGFEQRGREAVRCYQSGAYLGCCALCGAATESILLATVIAKTGDEKGTLESYRAANGRRRIENKLVGKADEAFATKLRGFIALIGYWRDESRHAEDTEVPEIEAYDALGHLLHFAHFADENWESLTGEG